MAARRLQRPIPPPPKVRLIRQPVMMLHSSPLTRPRIHPLIHLLMSLLGNPKRLWNLKRRPLI